jgi:preprotein translocase subunit SecF
MTTAAQLYRNQSDIDFRTWWKRGIVLSTVLILIAGGAWIINGLNLGIEFEGGVSWEFRADDLSTSEVRDALEPSGNGDARIQKLGGDLWRVRAEIDATETAEVAEVSRALADVAGLEPGDVSFSAVGPSWGDEITSKAQRALVVFLVLLTIYMWIRLEWKMAFAALVALAHDIIITVGVYALFQFEVTSATVIAFLTILGYSLYDTLIVFDRVKTNERRVATASKLPFADLASLSLNQVIMRSVNTTITSVLPVLSMLIVGRFVLGAVTLQEFALALLIGLLAGTYSSLFVATPILVWLKGFESHQKDMKAEVGDHHMDVTEASAALDVAERKATARTRVLSSVRDRENKRKATKGLKSQPKKATPAANSTATSAQTHPPRPRKKKRKK